MAVSKMRVVVRTKSSSPPLGSKPVLPEGPMVFPGNTDEVGIPLVAVPLVGIPVVELPVDGVPLVEFPEDGAPIMGVPVELQMSYYSVSRALIIIKKIKKNGKDSVANLGITNRFVIELYNKCVVILLRINRKL